MTLKTRRTIFYALVALFIIIGGGGALYADGWRLDFANWHITKVGGIYIRSFHQNAQIFVDGKSVPNQSGFLGNFLTQGTVISNLLPRTHGVTLKAAGYIDWHENAFVLPSFVVQFKYAVLVPKTGTVVTSTPASLATTASTTLAAAANFILRKDGELFRVDPNASPSSTPTKIADSVKNFAVTDDGSMLAALENKSLEIFTLSGDQNYYRFNLPNISAATRLIWYKDHTHLFIVYPDHVSFLDLADSSLLNYVTVARGTRAQYDPAGNALYIVAPNGKLMRYDFPS